MKLNMKNIKLIYFIKNIIIVLLPRFLFSLRKNKYLNMKSEYISDRVNYYNSQKSFIIDGIDSVTKECPLNVGKFKKTKSTKAWVYFFDIARLLKYFPSSFSFYYWPGDKTISPEKPNFVKSRPINDHNSTSILLNLDLVRHFNFLNDTVDHKNKLSMVGWRGKGGKEHRKVILRHYYQHPMCNIGSSKSKGSDAPWEKEFMSIKDQLNYKFIICPEGNDVATNLKWVMSSNSIAVMSKPKYETWFMEGKLIPDFHYILVKDDYSDLIEKITYFIENPEDSEKIIHNAHEFISQFKNKEQELAISLQVIDMYFKNSGQS